MAKGRVCCKEVDSVNERGYCIIFLNLSLKRMLDNSINSGFLSKHVDLKKCCPWPRPKVLPLRISYPLRTQRSRGGAHTFSAAITSPENGRIQQNHTHLTLPFQGLKRLRRVAHKRQTADDELSDAAICRHQEPRYSILKSNNAVHKRWGY